MTLGESLNPAINSELEKITHPYLQRTTATPYKEKRANTSLLKDNIDKDINDIKTPKFSISNNRQTLSVDDNSMVRHKNKIISIIKDKKEAK